MFSRMRIVLSALAVLIVLNDVVNSLSFEKMYDPLADAADDVTSCDYDGETYKHGDEWKPHPCRICKCRRRRVVCDVEECPEIKCKTQKYIPNGKCCPRCIGYDDRACNRNGELFKHGEEWNPDPCTLCKCRRRRIGCEKEVCPDVECDTQKRIPEGECCPVCVDTETDEPDQNETSVDELKENVSNGDPGKTGIPDLPRKLISWLEGIAAAQSVRDEEKGHHPHVFQFTQGQVEPVGPNGSPLNNSGNVPLYYIYVFKGPPGEPGPPGQPGIPAHPGIKGGSGDRGIIYDNFPSPPGLPGQKGEPGPPGLPGMAGFPGIKGEPGEGNGVISDSFPWMKGLKGEPGLPGFPGLKGEKGEFGLPGFPGIKGDRGYPGFPGLKGEPGSPVGPSGNRK